MALEKWSYVKLSMHIIIQHLRTKARSKDPERIFCRVCATACAVSVESSHPRCKALPLPTCQNTRCQYEGSLQHLKCLQYHTRYAALIGFFWQVSNYTCKLNILNINIYPNQPHIHDRFISHRRNTDSCNNSNQNKCSPALSMREIKGRLNDGGVYLVHCLPESQRTKVHCTPTTTITCLLLSHLDCNDLPRLSLVITRWRRRSTGRLVPLKSNKPAAMSFSI